MFEWDDKLSVEISEIDDQHKNLLRIGRDLVNVLETSTDGLDQYDEIKNLLQELHSYTVYHFTSEEELMEKANFIDLPSHRFQHKLFVKKLEEVDLDEIDQDQSGYTMDLLDFIANWITNHILKIDTQYAPIVKRAR